MFGFLHINNNSIKLFTEFELEIDQEQKFDLDIENQVLIWGMFRNWPVKDDKDWVMGGGEKTQLIYYIEIKFWS